MMVVDIIRKILILLLVAMMITSCSDSTNGKFKSYKGPEVTYVVVDKSARKMKLYHKNKVLKSYKVQLGFAPIGDKVMQGDGRTPEGKYRIDRKNPYSKFHLSLGISYPDGRDHAIARARGVDPGGDIFIHGGPTNGANADYDWTHGCIAVSDRQIEEIYARVDLNTPVLIRP